MSPDSSLAYSDVERHVRRDGKLTIELGSHTLELDLSLKHDRAYAAKLLLGVRHPQSDIDELLFRKLVRAGDVVLDAGANIGFAASQMLLAGAASVVAIEPVPEIFERLRSMRTSAVVARKVAISSSAGTGSLVLSRSHNQGSSLNVAMKALFPEVFSDAPETIDVELTTIDDLTSETGRFDLWKLDIEGAEVEALLGASATLKDSPPRAIVVELYEPFREAFFSLILPTHPFAYRAFIARDSYQLTLGPPDIAACPDFHETSPMYVFSLEELT